MNMILHDNPTALIIQGNTLTDPSSRRVEPSRPSTTLLPIRLSRTSGGALDWIR